MIRFSLLFFVFASAPCVFLFVTACAEGERNRHIYINYSDNVLPVMYGIEEDFFYYSGCNKIAGVSKYNDLKHSNERIIVNILIGLSIELDDNWVSHVRNLEKQNITNIKTLDPALYPIDSTDCQSSNYQKICYRRYSKGQRCQDLLASIG